MYPLPTCVKAWIDDVVVDEPPAVEASANRSAGRPSKRPPARRQGGRPHVAAAADAANRLYVRMGFVSNTNVYRFEFE